VWGPARGGSTPARPRRPGLIQETGGGTLFLDEVDSLTPRGQVALLRLLQERTYRPLGGGRVEQAQARFVAACNTPLETLVRAGAFRSDLFYRLSVITIRLPPLRERREDIPLLAARFLEKHTPAGAPVPRLDPAAQRALAAFDWPGNVRELESVIVRGIVLGDGVTIGPQDLGLPLAPRAPSGDVEWTDGDSYQSLKRQAIADFERHYLTRLMTKHRGNVSQAARAAGKERRELGKLLKKHQLDRSTFS
jgi:DNA-binding NtrC family response regulator